MEGKASGKGEESCMPVFFSALDGVYFVTKPGEMARPRSLTKLGVVLYCRTCDVIIEQDFLHFSFCGEMLTATGARRNAEHGRDGADAFASPPRMVVFLASEWNAGRHNA